MVGVGFHVHHVVVCQRLLLCSLTPMFCGSCGNWPGGKVPWRDCGLPGFACMRFPMGLLKTGVKSRWRSVIVLTSLMDLSERLVVLGWVPYPQGKVWSHWEKQLVAPLWYPGIVWGGVPGGRQRKLWGRVGCSDPMSGWAAQAVSSLLILFNCGQNPEVEIGYMFGLGWWMLFISYCHSTQSCVASPMPGRSSACCQPSLPWGKMMSSLLNL